MDFLKRFGEFERKLRKFADAPDATWDGNLLNRVCAKSLVVARRSDLIKDVFALRNVFSHQNQGGRYIAEVNSLAFEVMDEIEKYLKKPPTVGEFFKTNVYFARPNFSLDEVIGVMKSRVYTHVPIYDDNLKFKGILSETTIFNWLADTINKGVADFRKERVRDINPKYLFRSKNNGIEFFAVNRSIFDALVIFEESLLKEEKLGAILVTRNGKRDEEPIGIITAYDLPKIQRLIS